MRTHFVLAALFAATASLTACVQSEVSQAEACEMHARFGGRVSLPYRLAYARAQANGGCPEAPQQK